MTKRKSIHQLSPEEIKSGEWMKDPELLAEYKKMLNTLSAGVARAVNEMSDEDRETLRESLEDGTYEYGQDLIRAEGEM